MKSSFLISLLFSATILILFQSACRSPKDRIGGRITIDNETGKTKPLNKESCLYLAYESLCKNNLKESIRLIQLSDSFKSDRIIIIECLKTVKALTLLKQNKFTEANIIVQSILKVSSYKTEPSYSEELIQHPLRKLRYTARQLKKCESILAAYNQSKVQKKLDPATFQAITKNWLVTLDAKLPNNSFVISFPLAKN